MSIKTTLHNRSNNKCELFTSTENLSVYSLPHSPDETAKRGTPLRNIGLSNSPLHIEGKVNG
jgi:uncharacterized Zn ribbon protein